MKIRNGFVSNSSSSSFILFGVKIESGKLTPNTLLINENGEEIAKVKDIQENQNKIQKATQGMEIAISLPGTNFERQLQDKTILYSDFGEKQFKQFKENKDLLSQEEIQTLQEIAAIKRRENPTWGV